MKIRNWTRKLSAAVVAGGMALPVTTHAANLDVNLIVDPGFEDVDDSAPGNYGALPLNSWSDGSKIGFTYASGQYDNGGPLASGGERYFSSNQSSDGDVGDAGQVAQEIDLSAGDSATLIAAGQAVYNVSGFFTTYDTNEDFGILHLDFRDSSDASLAIGMIGPSSNEGGWVEHTGGGLIPVGTAAVLVSVYGDGANGGPDGYIDNVSFSVSQIPEPTSVLLAGLGFSALALGGRRKPNEA